MAWIKSYQALEKHPKLLKFMKTLNVNQNEAIGIIHKFWWWCLDYAETGNLLDVDPEILGNTLGVPNLLEALKTSGFVDIIQGKIDPKESIIINTIEHKLAYKKNKIDLILTDPP